LDFGTSRGAQESGLDGQIRSEGRTKAELEAADVRRALPSAGLFDFLLFGVRPVSSSVPGLTVTAVPISGVARANAYSGIPGDYYG
jgi:hypothetical protein